MKITYADAQAAQCCQACGERWSIFAPITLGEVRYGCGSYYNGDFHQSKECKASVKEAAGARGQTDKSKRMLKVWAEKRKKK